MLKLAITKDDQKDSASKIEALLHTHIENDHRVIDSKKRLTQLEGRPAEISGEIKKLEEEESELKQTSVQKVLGGGAADEGGLIRIRDEIARRQTRLEISQSVIEEARRAHSDLQAQIRKEYECANVEAFAETLAALNKSLQSVLDHFSLVNTAAGLPYMRGRDWSLHGVQMMGDYLREFKKIAADLQKCEEHAKEFLRRRENSRGN